MSKCVKLFEVKNVAFFLCFIRQNYCKFGALTVLCIPPGSGYRPEIIYNNLKLECFCHQANLFAEATASGSEENPTVYATV